MAEEGRLEVAAEVDEVRAIEHVEALHVELHAESLVRAVATEARAPAAAGTAAAGAGTSDDDLLATASRRRWRRRAARSLLTHTRTAAGTASRAAAGTAARARLRTAAGTAEAERLRNPGVELPP
jgi:hypothetical protein